MTFDELVAEVYVHTGRSDRVSETKSAVKAATLKAHNSDFYPRDMYETGVDFGSAAYTQSLQYKTLLTRWRAVKYLRKYDYTNSTPGKFLDLVPPENVMDYFKVQKQDIYYIAGEFLHVNSSTSEQYYLLGCFLNPNIVETTFSSWIADDFPYVIVFDAAATVFKAIGKDEEAAAYRTLVAEQLSLLHLSNTQVVGY